MTLEARRKNNGKQYTVVNPKDKVIRHWHRPGDPLPVIITYSGKDYLLTKEVVEEARVSQRSPLVVLQVDEQGNRLLPAKSKVRNILKKQVTRPTYYNGKATDVTPVGEEINWKAIGFVVVSLLLLGVIAAGITLGA